MTRRPRQGEIWLADLNPPTGHEQAGRPRPVLVVSGDAMNEAPFDLSLIVPLTTRVKRLPGHIFISASESGLRADSEIMCEHLRSISHQRFRSDQPLTRLNRQSLLTVVAQIDGLIEVL